MKSAKKSKSNDELDEDTPSRKTLERRRDRKLKDDITGMMYRLEMESIKPSFDVLLQTGLHRGLYGNKLGYKKRRPKTSKGAHGGTGEAGGVGRSHSAGKDEAAESRHSGDWHARLSAIHADSDKKKTEEDRAAGRWMSVVRDLSPARHVDMTLESSAGHSRVAAVGGTRSRMKDEIASPADSLSGMVIRASRLSAEDLDAVASARRSTQATLRRSGDYRYFPGAAVISVEELPRPQRGTYLLETRTLVAEDGDRAWSGSATGQPAHTWWRRSATQSDGPYAGVRPISLHGDELMAYVNETESAPSDFRLDAILAEPKHHQPRVQSVGASTGNVYTTDDEIGQMYRLLDNPFSGHEYERTVPKQHITFGDNYSSLPYTPKTIITSPSLRYA